VYKSVGCPVLLDGLRGLLEGVLMSMGSDNRIVWNSDQGRVGGMSAGKPKKRSNKKRPLPDAGFPKDGVTRVRRETGGRGGKTVTVLYGAPGSDDDRTRLFKELKKLCGCGGACKDGRIEIQGDQRDQIMAVLREKGIVAKAAGG
jgi:translation initiation factor 1